MHVHKKGMQGDLYHFLELEADTFKFEQKEFISDV
jgi:hypothetical protein